MSSAANSCRLCFSSDNCDDYLNIFDTTGDELRINDVISEHFKCDIREGDALPNFVCGVCWTTTESFHELYQQSKLAQEAFLNSTIKIEEDPIIVYPESNECNFVVDGIKLEPNSVDEQDAQEQDAFETVPISNVLDMVNDEEIPNPERDEHPTNVPRKGSRKELNSIFQRLFAENKHRLNLSCEKCSKKFKTLEDAQRHYPAKHNIATGYIKCTEGKCNIKLRWRGDVVQHLNRHLNPEKFECSECDKVLRSRVRFKIHMERHRTTKTQTGTEHGRGGKVIDPYAQFMAENFDMTCDLCDAKFTSIINARYHYKDAHDDKNGYVKCCGTKLRNRHSVNEHIDSHLNPGIFSCETCKKNFPTKNHLYQHMYRHKRYIERPYTCDMCGGSFSDKIKILRHFFARHVFDSELKFECEICSKRFPVIESLRSHMNSVHRKKKTIVTRSERMFQQRQLDEPDAQEQDALESNSNSNVLDTVSGEEIPNPTKNSKKYSNQEYNSTYWKLFNENKHLLDLSCEKCTTKFETLEDAQQHYPAVHNIAKGYIKCMNKKCKAKMIRPSAVVQHLNHHLNPEKFECSVCDRVLYQASFKSHMETHRNSEAQTGTDHGMSDGSTAINPYTRFMTENFDMTCDLCDATFTSFIKARGHYKDTHGVKRGYVKCCELKLRDQASVNEHIDSHLNPGIFSCETCKKNFPTKTRLYQHMFRHKRQAERPYTCDMCGESFSDKVKILRHFFAKHVFDSERKFECEICNKRYPLIESLQSHMNSVHREKKPTETCEICGKSFSLRAHLKRHMLTHADKSERLFKQRQCEYCGEWLMSKSGVYYHEQIHSKDAQKCDQCEMEFPNRISLVAHVRRRHRERIYKCKFCDKSYVSNSLLKKHEETHTRHKLYPCQFCTKEFTLSMSRLTHQKRTHPAELAELRKSRKLNKHLPTSS